MQEYFPHVKLFSLTGLDYFFKVISFPNDKVSHKLEI